MNAKNGDYILFGFKDSDSNHVNDGVQKSSNSKELNYVAYLAADGSDPSVSNGVPVNPTFYGGTVMRVPEDAQFGDTFTYYQTVDCTSCAVDADYPNKVNNQYMYW